MSPINIKVSSRGFTYIGLLIFVALMGIGLALAGQVWHTSVQREKEKELLFVGEQFHRAIARYYEGSPGGAKKFPRSLEELLDDRRYPTTKRHLRRIYIDPMTGRADWGFVTAPEGSIMGVHSLSEEEPRKVWGFQAEYAQFDQAKRYSDWKFIYSAEVVADGQTAPGAGVSPSPGGTPPVAIPQEPAVPTPIPTAPSRDDPNRRKICDNVLRTDRGRCALARYNEGNDVGALCDQSAQLRYAGCMDPDGSPMPPLVASKP